MKSVQLLKIRNELENLKEQAKFEKQYICGNFGYISCAQKKNVVNF